jgi:TetR/AcrR family transcriptional regulator
MARPARVSPDRILAAAAREFAERGYAGARVDRIARRARVNKAMLYYHFRSKQGLYRALLRQTFARAGARLQEVAASHAPPADKLDAAIAGIAAFIADHAFFPAIMLREIAEGGAHLDRDTLAALASVPRAVGTIIEHGIAERTFRPVHPLAAYFTMVAPVMFFLAGTPIRRELAAQQLTNGTVLAPDAFVRHVQDTMRRALAFDTRAETRTTS